MGRGNWFPGSRLENCRVAYIDYSNADIEDDDSDAWHWEWDYVKGVIAECLPESFTIVDSYADVPHHIRRSYYDGFRDSGVLAYNGLFTLWVDEHSDAHHTGIGLTVNEDAPAFARNRLDAMADAFFDRLSEMLELSVRTSAWTSAPYKKQAS